MDAFYTFLADDGWAIASHIALSTLMALFPFLIVLTSLAGFFGSKELADQAAGLMLQIWPQQVADSLSGEIHDVLTTTRGDALTIGLVLAVYFASNGVESLRVALNRAYAGFHSAGDGIHDRARTADTGGSPPPHSADRRNQPELSQLCALWHHHPGAGDRALHSPRMASGRPPRIPADPARHHLHTGGVVGIGHRVR